MTLGEGLEEQSSPFPPVKIETCSLSSEFERYSGEQDFISQISAPSPSPALQLHVIRLPP